MFRTGRGLLLAFDDEANTIALSDGSGANLLKINVNEGQLRVQSTTKFIVEAPQIELVEGAAHPLAFGDDLLQYLSQIVLTFNSHTHVGETVAGVPVTPMMPTPPFQPPHASMLSLRVRTG